MAAVPDTPIIIVGGGLGGVAAAASLLAAGKRVLLLEGSGRFGGRTRTAWSEAAPGVAVDLGGQWVAPQHTRMLALLRRIGVSPLALLEVKLRVLGSIEWLAATLPPSDVLSSGGGGRDARAGSLSSKRSQ